MIKLLGQSVLISDFRSQSGTKYIKISLNSYSPKLVAEIKEMEGAKSQGSNVWLIKDTPRNRFTIDLLADGHFNGVSLPYGRPIDTPPIINEELTGLWDHQKRLATVKVQLKRVIDAGEMGVGKTRQTLVAIKILQKLGFTGPVWWIAPNSGLTSLRTQLEKWGLNYLFHIPQSKIINYHKLERTMEQVTNPPQIVVFDECHALKNSGSRRTQLAMELTRIIDEHYGSNCAVFGLTGTPAPENHFDWWSLAEVVRPGYLKEASFNKYKFRLAEFQQGLRMDGGSFPQFVNWKGHTLVRGEDDKVGPLKGNCGNKTCEVCGVLPRRLEGLVHITWKKDCLDLPEKVYEEIELPPSPSTLRVAKAIARSGLRAIEIQSKLRQLSDGFQYITNETPSGEAIRVARGETPKDEALKDLLEEHQEVKRIVVYAAFTESVDRCVELCREMKWNVWRYDGRGQSYFGDYKSINESIFQSPSGYDKPIAFVGNPEAAGQGLTLTPAPTIVYYSNSFKSQYRVQSEDRIHRPGASKERGCKIVDLIHLPTDKLVLMKLKDKRAVELTTLQEIDACLENSVV